MGVWDALSDAMGTSRMRRIGPREAEQLINAGSDGGAYPELSHLLAAAAAPPRPDELVDLRSAVAAFEAAGRDYELSARVAARRRVFARSFLMKAAAGMAVVLFGGTALAAETGTLPRGAQQQAHEAFSVLGVPPPGDGSTPASAPAEAATPSPAPSSGNKTGTPKLSSAAVLGLCRSWDAHQTNPTSKPMEDEALRALAAAADGEKHIEAFCAPLLAADHGKPATTGQGTAAPTPSHPGNGNGRTQATTTPNPHSNG